MCVWNPPTDFCSAVWTHNTTRASKHLSRCVLGVFAASFLFSGSYEAELNGKIEKQNSCFSISSHLPNAAERETGVYVGNAASSSTMPHGWRLHRN